MFWRRAVDPNFDAKAVMPVLTGLLATLINPVNHPGSASAQAAAPAGAGKLKGAERT